MPPAMGKDEPLVASSSKTEKPPSFRFSPAGRSFLTDYFQNTNSYPKKQERQEILAHLKELGDTEANDTRVVGWFTQTRQKERKRVSLQPPTLAPELEEKKFVDARHKSLWPSVKKESIQHLEELYAEHIVQEGDAEPPHDLWAEGLHAKPEHVRMWCKFKQRQSTQQSQPAAAPTAEAPSHMAEERSQLPTPGNSTSPEPLSSVSSIARAPPSPEGVKDEPPVSPVVETTRLCPPTEGPKDKSSFGLHEAIESAFSASLNPPAHPIQSPKPPSATTQINQQRKPSPRKSSRALHIVLPPTPLSVSTNNTTSPTSPSLPPASIVSAPPQPESSPPPPDHEPAVPDHEPVVPDHEPAVSDHEPTAMDCEQTVPPSPKEPTPAPSAQPERDIARERTNLVNGIAAKFDELGVVFGSTHGLSQLAGSIQVISRRNQQFLGDVAIGRFKHARLTRAHLPGRQVENPMPEFNPLQILADRQGSKGEEMEGEGGGEADMEIDMDVD